MKKNIIKSVECNKDKQETYRSLNRKCKTFFEEGNYEALLLYSYAMIEDRLLSMLHYLYVINRKSKKLVPEDNIDVIIRPLLKYKIDSKKEEVYKINNISTKIKILKIFNLKNSTKSPYLNDCYKIIENQITIKKLNDFFKRLNKYIDIRNEIIHGSYNKNIADLNNYLKLDAIEGYELAKELSRYVNKIKDYDCHISVRTKWENIPKVFDEVYREYDEEAYNDLLNFIIDYDILCVSCYDYLDIKDELDNIECILKHDLSLHSDEPFYSKNDLNFVISNKISKNEFVYYEYVWELTYLSMLDKWNYKLTEDNIKNYCTLDEYFNIPSSEKKEIIIYSLIYNIFCYENLKSIDFFDIVRNSFMSKYFNNISKMNYDEVIETISKEPVYIIGLTDEQLKNVRVRDKLLSFVDGNYPDFIQEYSSLCLDREKYIDDLLNTSSEFYDVINDWDDSVCFEDNIEDSNNVLPF